MGRPLKRKLLDVRITRKNIRCLSCKQYIWKGSSYTHCTVLGFWGSYHDNCFRRISISLESKDTGELLSNSSGRRLTIDLQQKIDDLKKTNIQQDDICLDKMKGGEKDDNKRNTENL